MKTVTTKRTTDYTVVRQAALVLRAVNHRLRQRILDLLDDHGQLTVTDIYIALRLDQSVASQHLGILRQAGVVDTERYGKHIYYSKNAAKLESIFQTSKELVA